MAWPLDEVALSKYEWNGLLWFEGFFNQERMAPFFDELREMVQDKELLASDQVIQDPNTGDFRSVFDMHELFAHFNRLTRTPVSWAWSSSCSGVRSTFINRGLTTSWGLKSVGFTGHSDFGTWHSEDGMPRIRAVSASLMLTDNNEFNGVFQ